MGMCIFKGIDEFLWCDFLPQSYCAVLSVVLFIKRWLYLVSVWMKNESYGVTTILNKSSLAARSYDQIALTTS